MVETHRSGYAAIPGSASLRTGRAAGAPALRRVVVHRDFLPVPLDLFDRVALGLEPEELVVYLQLFRLSVGEEKNGCRVSRVDLERRARMSQLRLGKALAGLVEKGHVALLDRSREGTLYRVFLPEEVLDGASLPPTAAAPPPAARRARPPREPATEGPARSPGELARWFLQVGGSGRGRSADEVLQEIFGLLEEGLSLEEIQALLARFLKETPKRTPIAEVTRFRSAGG
jgi:hypothetical protein